MYDNKFHLIVYIWKPFYRLFGLIRTKWDIRTSVIDSFATFFLLSCMKILSSSFDLLISTPVYQFNSTAVSYRLYYDPSVTHFGPHHLPYAILALTMFLVFTVLPRFYTLILVLYPFHYFQTFFSYFSSQQLFLFTFVDSFQGCFKDGTEPRVLDCRSFAAVRLIIRVVFYITLAVTLGSMSFVYANLVLAVAMILFINFQPFKKATVKYPITDTVFLTLLSLSVVISVGCNVATIGQHNIFPDIFIFIGILSGLFPPVYVLFLMLHWIFSRRKWSRQTLTRLRFWKNH